MVTGLVELFAFVRELESTDNVGGCDDSGKGDFDMRLGIGRRTGCGEGGRVHSIEGV